MIKKIIDFIKFIEDEKRNAAIKTGNGTMLF